MPSITYKLVNGSLFIYIGTRNVYSKYMNFQINLFMSIYRDNNAKDAELLTQRLTT